MFKERLKKALYSRLAVSFAKSGDDIQLKQLLKEESPGFYVDVGCWHPTKASNSYHFYLRGWKGLCVDPNPELAVAFEAQRPHDRFVNVAISEEATEATYYMLQGPYSSMNSFDRDFLRQEGVEDKVTRTIQVPCLPLRTLLERWLPAGERLDFFDIDVEGMDFEVLASNDWDRYRPRVVVLETDLPLAREADSKSGRFLADRGYRLVARTAINHSVGNAFYLAED